MVVFRTLTLIRPQRGWTIIPMFVHSPPPALLITSPYKLLNIIRRSFCTPPSVTPLCTWKCLDKRKILILKSAHVGEVNKGAKGKNMLYLSPHFFLLSLPSIRTVQRRAFHSPFVPFVWLGRNEREKWGQTPGPGNDGRNQDQGWIQVCCLSSLSLINNVNSGWVKRTPRSLINRVKRGRDSEQWVSEWSEHNPLERKRWKGAVRRRESAHRSNSLTTFFPSYWINRENSGTVVTK